PSVGREAGYIHLKPYVAMAMPSHPRIGILASLIKGLPDLWPRLNDETAFSHFSDLTKISLVLSITNSMSGPPKQKQNLCPVQFQSIPGKSKKRSRQN